jgi:hypothetical protein
MKAINAIVPRGLQVLLLMAVMALLVWLFAREQFLYPAIGIAAFLVIVASFFIYHAPAGNSANKDNSKDQKKKRNKSGQDQEVDASADAGDESSDTEIASSEDAALSEPYKSISGFTSPADKPSAFDVADKYYQMAAIAKKEEEARIWKPKPAPVEIKNVEIAETMAPEDKADSEEKVAAVTSDSSNAESETEPDLAEGEPHLSLINDETSLTEEEKSELENAVWYRCENPYCKYTHFLDVHHIIDEKNGGTNKLDNLIVLCPYCHNLAHKNEIPEEEMRLWISNRQERFKFKLNWHYF